tara:strand:+ start:406 stop:1251 length:846 start_codon:yes stop_codon:yes gene_type:complete
MPEKKNNHYIPKLILKHWVTKNSENRDGVYVLDAVKGKSYFSSSKGKRGFSFAIGNDLYVPKIEDKRRVELEDWFGGLETTLAQVISKLSLDETKPLFQSYDEMVKFVLALFSFKHRTKYVIDKHKKYLTENPDKLKLISGRTDDNEELILLENIVNATTHDAINLSNFEMRVMKSKGKSLIMGDMPFLENVVDGFNFLPLTNKIFIGFRSIREKSFYTILESGDDLVESLNFAIASNSKYWIVADNISQIRKYEKELEDNLDKEPIYTPITFPIRGSTFK